MSDLFDLGVAWIEDGTVPLDIPALRPLRSGYGH